MVHHKPQFFLILPFEGCAFQEGEGDEDSWLSVRVENWVTDLYDGRLSDVTTLLGTLW